MKNAIKLLSISTLVVINAYCGIAIKNGLTNNLTVDLATERGSENLYIEPNDTITSNLSGKIKSIDLREFRSRTVGGPISEKFDDSKKLNSKDAYIGQKFVLVKEEGRNLQIVVLPKKK